MSCFFCERPVEEAQPFPDMPPSHYYCRMAALLRAHGYQAFTLPPHP